MKLNVPTLLAATTVGISIAIAATPAKSAMEINNRDNESRCYQTRNESKVCALELKNNTFAVSITRKDGDYPSVYHVTCGDKFFWRSWGLLEHSESATFMATFCRDFQ